MSGFTPILTTYSALDPYTYMAGADAEFAKLWAEIANIEGVEALPSNSNPTMAGVAAPGVLASYARGDHVHPSDTSRVNKAGDTMTGNLILNADPTVALGAVTKQYSDNTKVSKTGDTMTGGLTISSAGLTINPPTGAAQLVIAPQTPTNGVNIYLKKNGSGSQAAISSQNVNSYRWIMILGNTTPESGANVGSDFWLNRYDDTGTSIDFPFKITRSNAQLTITGAPYCPGGGSWNASSDSRIKNVTGQYQRGLTEIAQLRPVTFTYKGNDTTEAPAEDDSAVPYHGSPHYHAATTGIQYAGLIAQELEAVMPELVTRRSGYIDGQAVADMRDFNQGPLVFALINAVRELMVAPACSVYSSVAQSIPAVVATKIQFDTAEYDVTSAFDLANNRFQPTVAGYYQVNCGCGVAAGAVQNYTSIYKNGVEYRRSTTSNEGGNTRLSTLVQLNGTTDYVEGFVLVNKAFDTIPGGILTSFSAALISRSASS